MLITYFQRRPANIHYSIELLFDSIRKQLPAEIKATKWVAPQFSTGLWPRIRMTLAAKKAQKDINHITGDIHFIALGLKKKRTILTIHDLGVLNNSPNLIAKWIFKTFWITLPIKNVSKVTVVSEATKQELLKVTGISPEKVRVIGNFIPDTFTYSPKIFNSKQPRILHIGSAYNKNLNRLIDALIGLNCHLVIIGHPTIEQIKTLKKNTISHEIKSGLSDSELIEEYRQCDLLSFVSLLEGFGLPILEAQATGRPVVTSNLSSMPEVAGTGACYVNPLETNSIRQGLLKVINEDDFRTKLIENGLVNVKRFSLKKVVEQYCNLYQEVYNKSQS